MALSNIEKHYNKHPEDLRLQRRHGMVEFETTMHHLRRHLPPGSFLLDIGAGTGRYASALMGEGFRVKAVELVRRNIEALRGRIDIDSTPGTGTTFTIRLPLTLAIIDGFLVGIGNSSYVIPLDAVVECIDLADDDSATGGRGTTLQDGAEFAGPPAGRSSWARVSRMRRPGRLRCVRGLPFATTCRTATAAAS